jgi:hypothetical protein
MPQLKTTSLHLRRLINNLLKKTQLSPVEWVPLAGQIIRRLSISQLSLDQLQILIRGQLPLRISDLYKEFWRTSQVIVNLQRELWITTLFLMLLTKTSSRNSRRNRKQKSSRSLSSLRLWHKIYSHPVKKQLKSAQLYTPINQKARSMTWWVIPLLTTTYPTVEWMESLLD